MKVLMLCTVMLVAAHASKLSKKEMSLLKDLMENLQEKRTLDKVATEKRQGSVDGSGSGYEIPDPVPRARTSILYPGLPFMGLPPLISPQYADIVQDKRPLRTQQAMSSFVANNQLAQGILAALYGLSDQMNTMDAPTKQSLGQIGQEFFAGYAQFAPQVFEAIMQNTAMGARAVTAGTDEVDEDGEPIEEPCKGLVCSINKIALLVAVTDSLTYGGAQYMKDWNYVLPCGMITSTLEEAYMSGEKPTNEAVAEAMNATLKCRLENIGAYAYGFNPVAACEGPEPWLPCNIVPMGMWSHVMLNLIGEEVAGLSGSLEYLTFALESFDYYVKRSENTLLTPQQKFKNMNKDVKKMMEKTLNKRFATYDSIKKNVE